jgi:hypothetical protein
LFMEIGLIWDGEFLRMANKRTAYDPTARNSGISRSVHLRPIEPNKPAPMTAGLVLFKYAASSVFPVLSLICVPAVHTRQAPAPSVFPVLITGPRADGASTPGADASDSTVLITGRRPTVHPRQTPTPVFFQCLSLVGGGRHIRAQAGAAQCSSRRS